MRRTRFDDAPCPIARTTDLIGDWWTPIVMREAFTGARRFDEFIERLDVPRATLTQRLERLVDEGLLRKVEYQQRPVRHEYRLTPQGIAFYDVLAAMWRWGSDWRWPDGEEPPLELVDRESGARVEPAVVDERTGERIDVRRLRVRLRR
ncbi:MAG: helix-turn-helix domain-containing protein [Actinomycetota bacterium]